MYWLVLGPESQTYPARPPRFYLGALKVGDLGGPGGGCVKEESEAGSKARPWTGGLETWASQETGREPGMPWFWCSGIFWNLFQRKET